MNLDANRVWKEASSLLERELSVKDFQTWIRDLRPRRVEGNVLTLGAPFGLYRDRIRKEFLPAIENAVSMVARTRCRVAVVVDEDGGEGRPFAASSRPPAAWPSKAKTPVMGGKASRNGSAFPGGAGRARTFENFIVGEANRMAYLAARHVVDGSLGDINPVFLYGGVGLGKTHLLSAVRNALRASGGRVLYYPGEEFTRRMVDALHEHRMSEFRREFRLADALLIDDVQCMVDKKRTQQELAEAFNLLHAAGKPIAFASDRPPSEIQTFEQGLKNRFQGGLITELRPPDKTLRTTILRAKLREAGIPLEEELVNRLSIILQGSIREMEGVVANLRLASAGCEGRMEDAVLETVIAPFLKTNGPVSLDTVIDTVGWAFGVSREEILSRSRTRRISTPRHVAAYLCRRLTGSSSTEIGYALGGRKHTSVLRADKGVRDRACDDPGFANRLRDLERMLGGVGPAPRNRGSRPEGSSPT